MQRRIVENCLWKRCNLYAKIKQNAQNWGVYFTPFGYSKGLASDFKKLTYYRSKRVYTYGTVTKWMKRGHL